MRQGRPEPALEFALKAESLGGAYPWLRSMLGVLHHQRGDIERAREWFTGAIELDPARRDAIEALASIAFARYEWDHLRDSARRMVAEFPDDSVGWSFLGTAEARAGSDDVAEEALQRALELTGRSVDSQRNLASFLINCGRIEEAKAHLERALESDPGHALLHAIHAQCMLILEGSTREAWREYEWRVRLPGIAPPDTAGMWKGELCGELRIFGEQGLGDMLLFARLLPEAMRRCELLRLEVPVPLVPLFRATAERLAWKGADVTPLGLPANGARSARHLPFMSLMDVLGPAVPTPDGAYLLPSEAAEREWRESLGPRRGRLRVGLVWAGNPAREDDVLRSIPPAALAPLGTVQDVEYVSLQKDALPKYFVDLPLPLRDPTSDIRNFCDSAAILRQCDLLISIDTAAAHLAGACGVPCWVLLPQARDWRWEMGGVVQPWYPAHRSFRIARNREWLPLVERVAAELAELTPSSR
jgi:hypothetical protein